MLVEEYELDQISMFASVKTTNVMRLFLFIVKVCEANGLDDIKNYLD